MIRIVGAAALAVVAGMAWGQAPPLPTPRAAHAVVVADGAIHVLGGPETDRVDRFDGHAWRLETRLPGGVVNAPAAAALGKEVYVIGGFVGQTNEPTADVWVYDTATRRWSAGPPLPAPRGGAAAVVLDGRIHVIGGGNNVSTLASHTVFDPATRRWSEAAPLPRAEGSVAAVVRAGRIYAIGGRSGFSDFGDTYVYASQANRWLRGPRIPPRATAGAAVWRGSIYLFGGESQATGSVLGDVYRLAPGDPSWKRVGTLPTPATTRAASSTSDGSTSSAAAPWRALRIKRLGAASWSGSCRGEADRDPRACPRHEAGGRRPPRRLSVVVCRCPVDGR